MLPVVIPQSRSRIATGIRCLLMYFLYLYFSADQPKPDGGAKGGAAVVPSVGDWAADEVSKVISEIKR